MVVRGVAPPHIDLASKVGVELVDRRREDRFLVPCRPKKRIERHAAVDPAGGVARVERVRQWRQQVLGGASRLLDYLDRLAAMLLGKVMDGQATDQRFRQLAIVQACKVASQFVDEAEP